MRKILTVREDVYLCEANQTITKNGNYLSQIIAKNSNIWTSVVLIWTLKVAKQKLPILPTEHSSEILISLNM